MSAAAAVPAPTETTPTAARSKLQQAIADSTAALITQLQAGNSAAVTDYLTSMARFHEYSFGNVMLIALQCRNATHVAGFRKWLELKRYVRKGEKGIRILAPMIAGEGKRKKDTPGQSQPAAADGPRLIGFRAVYVFDISQTEGEPLPQPINRDIDGDATDALATLTQFVAARGIALEFADDLDGANGVSHMGKIRLLSGRTDAETFSTLAHEVAHELLHGKAERRTLSTTVKETEAEAVSFVVCSAIGLQCGNRAADYIGLYNGDAETLAASLKRIQEVAAELLQAIEQ